MTNNAGKRVDIELSIEARILIPKCPKTIMLDGGGQIETKALTDATLDKIADLWKAEFKRKARPEAIPGTTSNAIGE